nr:pentatricopeptide repeat-containing protein, chloroplastic [Quercus suber]
MRRRFGLFPDRHSFPFLFKACARLSLSHKGQELHSLTFKLGLQHDVFVQNALLSMYSFCGLLHNSRQVFDEMPLSLRDVVSWNSMVSGYIQGRCHWDALKVFDEMLKCDVNTRPDEVTLINALTACARIGFLDMGRKIHGLLCPVEVNLDWTAGISSVFVAGYEFLLFDDVEFRLCDGRLVLAVCRQ